MPYSGKMILPVAPRGEVAGSVTSTCRPRKTATGMERVYLRATQSAFDQLVKLLRSRRPIVLQIVRRTLALKCLTNFEPPVWSLHPSYWSWKSGKGTIRTGTEVCLRVW